MDFFISKLQDETLLNEVITTAQKNNTKVYLVGGCLRDIILNNNKNICDFDFALKKGSIDFAKKVARQIKGYFVLLDKEHGCARVVYNLGLEAYTLDFADFRAPDIKEDLRLRDFSINTLAVDISKIKKAKDLTAVLLDYYGGLKDLGKKSINIVTNRSFKDDPLRIIRAFSLSCILNFKISAPTLAQIKKDKLQIPAVAFERIRDELFKIFNTPRAAETLSLMDKMKVLEIIIPEINIRKGLGLGEYHHLDVRRHSLETVLQLELVLKEANNNPKIESYLGEVMASDRKRGALLKLGALLHDIGKPKSMKIEEGRTRFHGHEHIGRRMVKNISERIKLSTRENDALERIILWHLRPGYLADFKMPTARAVFRYFRDTAEEGISILLISLADQRATRGPLTSEKDRSHHEKVIMDLINYYFSKKEEKKLPRLITGYDLINKFKLKPSPLFKKILSAVEEAQALGKIKTKKEALELARRIVK